MPIILYNDICRIEKNITRDAKERKDEKKQKLTEREQKAFFILNPKMFQNVRKKIKN